MKVTHPVAEGEVYCARQHRPVDVMACYGCDKVIEIDLDSRRPRVVCSDASEQAPTGSRAPQALA